MAPELSREAAHHRARVGALSRDREPGDPVLDAARRDLHATQCADYIKETLAKAPPLTSEQRAKLAELLRPVRPGGAAT